jgi:glycosyltransferase involved in cell wall biosynthesis
MDHAEARRLCGLPQQGHLIGFVGGAYTRDAHFMAEAFNRVLEKQPDARLVLCGSFNRQISALVHQPDAIITTGRADLDTLFTWLSACDLCWLPLLDSGANRGRLPLKLNDYMAAGRAVVSTAVGDLPELLETHSMGVVTPDRPDLFAAATLDLLADPERAAELGRRARQAAEIELNWVDLAARLELFYMKLLSAEK